MWNNLRYIPSPVCEWIYLINWECAQDYSWVVQYNLVYTTNNIYLTQKQGGGASK